MSTSSCDCPFLNKQANKETPEEQRGCCTSRQCLYLKFDDDLISCSVADHQIINNLSNEWEELVCWFDRNWIYPNIDVLNVILDLPFSCLLDALMSQARVCTTSEDSLRQESKSYIRVAGSSSLHTKTVTLATFILCWKESQRSRHAQGFEGCSPMVPSV